MATSACIPFSGVPYLKESSSSCFRFQPWHCAPSRTRRAGRKVIARAEQEEQQQQQQQKKRPWWWDPFDYGEDPNIRNGDLFGEGPQEPEEPLAPLDPNSPHGYRKFPSRHLAELASLGPLLRGDVRRCCCFVAGGVYENLLFFPIIQLLKDRYPGVTIDIVATERGKQTYEINKHVRYAWVYPVDDDFVEPSVYMEFVGKIKGLYYDMIVSTKLAGLGHSMSLLMTGARDKISYIYPNVNAVGSDLLLSEAVKAPRINLAEGGYNMYTELVEFFSKPGRYAPKTKVQPLQVSISKRLKEVVQKKYCEQGVSKEDFLVFHGIESDSEASMQSKGDPDNLLPLELWAELLRSTSMNVVFIIPKETERQRVQNIIGNHTKAVFISTPGQLAAMISEAKGVVTTNTAAVQLACALRKPSLALFSSTEKASLYVPDAAGKRCTIVASKTGKLVDIDIREVISSLVSITESFMVTV